MDARLTPSAGPNNPAPPPVFPRSIRSIGGGNPSDPGQTGGFSRVRARHATCPSRLPGGQHHDRLEKILVPHDFSDTSEAAVRYAIALAHNFGAQLYMLHVSDKAKFEMATEFPLGLDGTLEDAVRERLRQRS